MVTRSTVLEALDRIARERVDLSDICLDPTPRQTPYGEQDENGVDWSLVGANLRLTPTQRLERNRDASAALVRMRGLAFPER